MNASMFETEIIKEVNECFCVVETTQCGGCGEYCKGYDCLSCMKEELEDQLRCDNCKKVQESKDHLFDAEGASIGLCADCLVEEKASPLARSMFEQLKASLVGTETDNHWERNWELTAITCIDSLPVETSVIFKRFTYTSAGATFNSRIQISCSGVEEENEGDTQKKSVMCKFIEKQEKTFTLAFVHRTLEEIKTMLPKLHFNKYISKLYEGPSDSLEQEYFGETFMGGEQCCVCLDKTQSVTECGHALCCICWSKLKKRKCPCCRKNIWTQSQANEIQETSDEEEEA